MNRQDKERPGLETKDWRQKIETGTGTGDCGLERLEFRVNRECENF